MVYRVRKRLVEECFEAVLSRKPRAMPAIARIFDGEKEAKLIALACSKPPKGRARWSLRLLENKVVELGIVDRASDSTNGRTLKKTLFSPIAASTGSSRRRPGARKPNVCGKGNQAASSPAKYKCVRSASYANSMPPRRSRTCVIHREIAWNY